MTDQTIRLIEDAYQAHVAAHGPRCGVKRGFAKDGNACEALRRAWALTHPDEAKREGWQFVRQNTPADVQREWRRKSNRSHYERHRAEHNRQSREGNRRRYQERPAEFRAKAAVYRATHHTERLAYDAAYRAAHREELNAYMRAYRAAKKAA